MNAVDTNVFIYALDADEPSKQAKAQALLDQLVQKPAETILLWQVAGELLSCLRKWESAGLLVAADVEAYFHDVLTMFPLRFPAAAIFAMSFELRSCFSLSHWDSMLLAACQDADVDLLYSEDLDPSTDYNGVRILNPFA